MSVDYKLPMKSTWTIVKRDYNWHLNHVSPLTWSGIFHASQRLITTRVNQVTRNDDDDDNENDLIRKEGEEENYDNELIDMH